MVPNVFFKIFYHIYI